jgi:acyl carrier protein
MDITTYQQIRDQLIKSFRIAPELLTPHTTFAELGISSLGLAELETVLEDELDAPVRVPDGFLRASSTLAEAAEVLHPILRTARSD